MEAMSFSIPVIGTNVGGVSEIIQNGKNGYLLSPNPEVNEIIEVLTKLYNLDEHAYLNLRQNAYQTWQSKFNAEANYSELIYNMIQLSKNY
jgi:glycosyltransferase involved in cell wall biosynthesis